jgi:hypothetical protein
MSLRAVGGFKRRKNADGIMGSESELIWPLSHLSSKPPVVGTAVAGIYIMRIGPISPRRFPINSPAIVGLDALRSTTATKRVPAVVPSPAQDRPLTNELGRMLSARESQRAQIRWQFRWSMRGSSGQSTSAGLTEWDIDGDLLEKIIASATSVQESGLYQPPPEFASESERPDPDKKAAPQPVIKEAEPPSTHVAAPPPPRVGPKPVYTRKSAYRAQTLELRRHAEVVANPLLEQRMGIIGGGFGRPEVGMMIPMMVGAEQSITSDRTGLASRAARQTKNWGTVPFEVPAFQGSSTGAYSISKGAGAA